MMASNILIIWVAIVMLIMITRDTMCDDKKDESMNADSIEKIQGGLSVGEKIASSISSLADPNEPNKDVFGALGTMASFLGAYGGFISFILLFVPKSESAEIKLMKKKFAEVNQKLDQITTELDNIKDLIKFENQRSVLRDSASKILFAHKQLFLFLDELNNTSCGDKKNCKRVRARIAYRYVEDFNVRQDIFKIMHGAVKPTSVFGDPILSLVSNTFKCDVGKIDQFANGILKLAFKAQQAILAYEKLIGSKYSITRSMDDWLESLYDVRKKADSVKNDCFKKIKDYMIKDIKEKKYQVGVNSNREANQKIKSFMEKKYDWLGWMAHSYGAWGYDEHCVWGAYGDFKNMPKDKDERKRNLIVSPVDKSGTFKNQKYKVLRAIDSIVARKMNFYGIKIDNVCTEVFDKVAEEFKKADVWKYITTLNILNTDKSNSLEIAKYNDHTFISREYNFGRYRSKDHRHTVISPKVRLVIVLKSEEEANGILCDKRCGHGQCMMQPYSSAKYCQCNPYYQGDRCQDHAKAKLAKTVDVLLAATLRLPMLSDIAFDIEDLREYVGINFGAVKSAISHLEAEFKKAFDDLSRKLTNQFQWSNLITHYSHAIGKIEFYSYRFEQLPKRYPKTQDIEGKILAAAVLAADGIEKWLYELNYLFLGRSGTPLLNHDPLMIVFMNRHKSQACSTSYKAAVGNTWRQLVLLQQIGFMVWIQALNIMGRPTTYTAQLYESRIAAQVSKFNETTCQYSIDNSVNVQCSGGRYIHPGISIVNQCEANYYLKGTAETACGNHTSECNPCNCTVVGSNGTECTDQSGVCSCMPAFYGEKCESRDCVWSAWSNYSTCSMNCSYGGKKTRTRYHNVTARGQGRICNGSDTESIPCFVKCCSGEVHCEIGSRKFCAGKSRGCCNGQFHCVNGKKCVSHSTRCNYRNDCGDRQDESSCYESCFWRYTSWNSHGGGNLVYFDRHTLSCGGSGYVLQMFHLQRSGGSMRYQYRCCRLTSTICYNTNQYSRWTSDGRGNTIYLDRQSVSCGDYGYLGYFRLKRGGNRDVNYHYQCCNLYSSYRRTTCYNGYTGYTYNGGGKNFYLDRQTVQCNSRYFLTRFQLQNSHSSWRYYYRCCKQVY